MLSVISKLFRPPRRFVQQEESSVTSQSFKKPAKFYEEEGPPIYKLQMCKYIKSGEGCRKGSKCTYAHTDAELEEGQTLYAEWMRERGREPREPRKRNDKDKASPSKAEKNYSPSPKQQRDNTSRETSPNHN